jgi:GntR family transcriptional regulator, transcriptional repressor for pyruvate dehydrogenase complex
VVGPVRRSSLTSGNRPVKPRRGLAPGAQRHQSKLLEPIKKTRIPEEIADRLRRLILDATFEPGRALPSERVLARRFGVSRGSVRDALRMLEMLGLLEMRHGQGTFPQELSVDRLVAPLTTVLSYRSDLQDELMDVRRMFEPAVVRVAALRVTEDDLTAFERVLGAQRRKLKTGHSAIAEDTAFHAALARATRNRVIVHIMETLNNLLVESRKQTLRQKGRPERSLEGHEAIVTAVRQRDPDGAARAMHDHIDQIANLMHNVPASSAVENVRSANGAPPVSVKAASGSQPVRRKRTPAGVIESSS